MNTRKATVNLLLFAVVVGIVGIFGWRSYSPNEQAVYRVIVQPAIDSRLPVRVVAMSYPSTCQASRGHIDGISDELVSEFLRVNKEGAKPLRLYSLEDVMPVLAWDLNRQFYSRPDLIVARAGEAGLLTLSRVAFSEDGSEALMCVQSLSDRYSEGNLLHFKKTKSGWVLFERRLIWLT